MKLDEAIAHAREVASRKFDDRVHCIRCAEEHEQLAEWLEELKEYQAIGTPKECRAAVEKQKAKKVMRNKTMNIYFCPVCERRVNYMHTLYCSGCGQKLDWSDEE